MSSQIPHVDAVIVGAGFAGLYMLYRLLQQDVEIKVFERADGVGGTWYWNRYPGARCDVESLEYSYSFSEELQQEWQWSERYSGQPEILRYANHVADRFELRDHIQFNTSVLSAHFDETKSQWRVQTDQGDDLWCQYLIMATGCLSSTNLPKINGIDDFKGKTYHTGRWPHETVDFSGQRVGIIGTGSSAIQAIPHIAKQADQLVVFQRTPNYSIPARNHPADLDQVQQVKANYKEFREVNRTAPAAIRGTMPGRTEPAISIPEEEREQELWERWEHGGFAFMGAFSDMGLNKEANDIAATFVRDRIKEIVKAPDVAETLAPDNVIGCKRICLDTHYFETYNQPHVSLVDINQEPIEVIYESGLRTDKTKYELDAIVFATGFDAMTGTLLRIDIRGVGGQTLSEKWSEGPKTYLGILTSSFPNLFMISGPGSPSVLTNMIVSIEQHVDWIADCLIFMRDRGYAYINPDGESEEEWVHYVNQIADMTLYPTCNSWYLGANIPGKPRVFMPHIGFPNYVQRCEEVVANDYQGFQFGEN